MRCGLLRVVRETCILICRMEMAWVGGGRSSEQTWWHVSTTNSGRPRVLFEPLVLCLQVPRRDAPDCDSLSTADLEEWRYAGWGLLRVCLTLKYQNRLIVQKMESPMRERGPHSG